MNDKVAFNFLIAQWTCLDVSLYGSMYFFFFKLYTQERVIELLTICILFSLQKSYSIEADLLELLLAVSSGFIVPQQHIILFHS